MSGYRTIVVDPPWDQVSPGPYAELFSRRARFGWDYPIGDQALGGIAA